MVSAGRCAPWGCARCVLCVCPLAALPVPVRVRKLAEKKKRREEKKGVRVRAREVAKTIPQGRG